MLIMTLAHAQASGNGTLISKHVRLNSDYKLKFAILIPDYSTRYSVVGLTTSRILPLHRTPSKLFLYLSLFAYIKLYLFQTPS